MFKYRTITTWRKREFKLYSVSSTRNAPTRNRNGISKLTEWNAIKQRNGSVISVVGVIKPLPVGFPFGVKEENLSGFSGDDKNCTSRGHSGLLGQDKKLTQFIAALRFENGTDDRNELTNYMSCRSVRAIFRRSSINNG